MVCFLSILLIAVSVHSAVSYQREAEILHQIGLFQGTDEGFELGKAFTRAEGATMLVRLLGKEEEALSSVKKSGFPDVPDWAEPFALKTELQRALGRTPFRRRMQ